MSAWRTGVTHMPSVHNLIFHASSDEAVATIESPLLFLRRRFKTIAGPLAENCSRTHGIEAVIKWSHKIRTRRSVIAIIVYVTFDHRGRHVDDKQRTTPMLGKRWRIEVLHDPRQRILQVADPIASVTCAQE